VLSDRVWSVFYRIDWEEIKKLGDANAPEGELPVELYKKTEKNTAERFPEIPRFDAANSQANF
jgi:hypothetical protein